ncbi:MAG: undecaprenyl-diphosphate phosphatase [Oscillospiraceae bacterium]|nr:undecaprenyl-diphosphate phosphatase [Oscillospiraceae bacterium]
MDMNWLQSLLYGLLSGFTEFVPVSARAHESIMQVLFGVDKQPLLQLFVNIGTMAALLVSCVGQISRIRREERLAKVPRKRRKRQPDVRQLLDVKLLKIAALPILIATIFWLKTSTFSGNLCIVSIFLILNGMILYLPEHLPGGNKDSRNLSPLDGLLIGLSSALSVLPGVSRIGAASSVAAVRGADRQYALNLSLLLSIPVMTLLLILDVYFVATAGLTGVTFLVILQCLLSSLTAYFGAYSAIMLMRFLSVKAGFSGFAYYSWGAALFSFILFLMT